MRTSATSPQPRSSRRRTEIAPGVFAGALADNGGPTPTIAIRADGPAAGAADPATRHGRRTSAASRGTTPPTSGPSRRGRSGGLKLVGGPGADVLTGGAGDDRICGRGGNDLLRGLAGDDLLRGGKGCDMLKGGDGDDVLFGGKGHDRIAGEPATTCCTAAAGTTCSSSDRLRGGHHRRLRRELPVRPGSDGPARARDHRRSLRRIRRRRAP